MSDKVLIVDSDKNKLELVCQVLDDIDAQPVGIDAPQAALEFLQWEEVAVLLVNDNLAVKSGLQLIEEARDIAPDVVAIVISARADLDMALRAINRCQVFRFITAPWEPGQLIEPVREALLRYHGQRIVAERPLELQRSGPGGDEGGDEIAPTETGQECQDIAVRRLTLSGDFTIAGIGEQLPLLLERLEEILPANSIDPSQPASPLEIDLGGVEELDASGCQLLAVLFGALEQRGLPPCFVRMSDIDMARIRLLGFGGIIPAGEHT